MAESRYGKLVRASLRVPACRRQNDKLGSVPGVAVHLRSESSIALLGLRSWGAEATPGRVNRCKRPSRSGSPPLPGEERMQRKAVDIPVCCTKGKPKADSHFAPVAFSLKPTSRGSPGGGPLRSRLRLILGFENPESRMVRFLIRDCAGSSIRCDNLLGCAVLGSQKPAHHLPAFSLLTSKKR